MTKYEPGDVLTMTIGDMTKRFNFTGAKYPTEGPKYINGDMLALADLLTRGWTISSHEKFSDLGYRSILNLAPSRYSDQDDSAILGRGITVSRRDDSGNYSIQETDEEVAILQSSFAHAAIVVLRPSCAAVGHIIIDNKLTEGASFKTHLSKATSIYVARGYGGLEPITPEDPYWKHVISMVDYEKLLADIGRKG